MAPPPAIDGVSFKGALLNTAQAEHPPFYWEFCTSADAPGVAKGKGWRQAVRNGTWKGVSFFSEAHKMELYDLASDIGETTDVAAAHPAIVEAFWAFAKAAHVESSVFPSGDAACVAS